MTLDRFPEDIRARLEAVRGLIVEIAARTEGVGAVVEEVKWGQPSLATVPRTGTPIRLGVTRSGRAAIFVHCQTTVIADFLAGPGQEPGRTVEVEGNRAVILPDDPADLDRLRPLLRAALTYHLR